MNSINEKKEGVKAVGQTTYVSTELKPNRKPAFINDDLEAAAMDMCNKQVSKLAFDAAYVRTKGFTRLPARG